MNSFSVGDLINYKTDYGYVVKIEPHPFDIICIKWFKYDQTFRYNINTDYFKKVT
jgi:hypothetical protein